MAYVVALATAQEREYYENVLYPLQNRVLALAGEYGDALVLTGGTALARAYFHHRYSDDIDLFVGGAAKAQHIAIEFLEIVAASGLSVDVTVSQPAFVRAFVGSERLQVDIAHDLPRLAPPLWNAELATFVHTLEDLGGNKISAFEDRAEIKDVFDLYFLASELSWPAMFAAADRKRVPIAFDALNAVMSQSITGTVVAQSVVPDLETFIELAREQVSQEIKKKRDEWAPRCDEVISELLWDAPWAQRHISEATRPVLERRVARLSLPQRLVLEDALRDSAARAHPDV